MTRNRRLGTVQHFDKMANAYFALLKQIQNPQPGSIGQRPKYRLNFRLLNFVFHIRLSKYTPVPKSGQEHRGRIRELGIVVCSSA
jgi:hypothetical protein